MRFSKRTVYVVVMVAAVSAVLMALTVNALGARSGGGGNDKGGGNDQGHNGNGQGNGHGRQRQHAAAVDARAVGAR